MEKKKEKATTTKSHHQQQQQKKPTPQTTTQQNDLQDKYFYFIPRQHLSNFCSILLKTSPQKADA